MMANFVIHQLNAGCITPLHNIIDVIFCLKAYKLHAGRDADRTAHLLGTIYLLVGKTH